MRVAGAAISAVVMAVVSLTSFACTWGRYEPPSGSGPATPTACTPVDPQGFTPPAWKPPRAAAPNTCTTDQIAAFADACIGVEPAACRAALTGFETDPCVMCLRSVESDAQWGPYVDAGSFYELNLLGCFALVDGDASAESCAARIDAVSWCHVYACETCDETGAALDACLDAAGQTSTCGALADTRDATCNGHDPPFRVCTPSGDEKAEFRTDAEIFCGSGPP